MTERAAHFGSLRSVLAENTPDMMLSILQANIRPIGRLVHEDRFIGRAIGPGRAPWTHRVLMSIAENHGRRCDDERSDRSGVDTASQTGSTTAITHKRPA